MNLGSVYIGVRAKTDQYQRDLANAKTMTEKAAVQLQHGIDSVNFKALGVKAAASFAAISYGFISLSKDAAMLASRFEILNVVMNQVGGNAGYSAGEMSLYDKALRKTGITMIESRNSLIKMTQAQLDLSKATELARISQDAAVIGNINSSEAFQRMIYGIQSGQTVVLKTIGINVNFENSYKKVAQATNRTTTSFSQAEKAIIRQNTVLEYGSRIAGTYESAMGTAGKKLSSFTRYVEDFKVMMGQAFGPAMVTMIDSATSSMKQLQDEVSKPEVQEALSRISGDLADILVSLSSDIPGKFKKINDSLTGIWNILSYDPAIIEYGLIGLALGGKKGALLLGSIGHMVTWIQNLSAALGMASAGLISFSEIAGTNFKELEKLVKGFDGNEIESLTWQIERLKFSIKNLGGDSKLKGFLSKETRDLIKSQKEELAQLESKLINLSTNVDIAADKYFNFGGVGSYGLRKIADETDNVTAKTKEQIKAAKEYQALVENLFKPIKIDDTWAKDEKKYWDEVIQKAEEYKTLIDNLFIPVSGEDTWAEDEAKFFEDIGKAQEEALKDQAKATQKALDDQTKAYEHMYENIHDIMGDFWDAALDGQMDSWDDFMDYILDTFKKTFSQILAQASTQIVMNIVTGTISTDTGIVGTISNSITNKIGSTILSSVTNAFSDSGSIWGSLFSSGSSYYGGSAYMVSATEGAASATAATTALSTSTIAMAGVLAGWAAMIGYIIAGWGDLNPGIGFRGNDAGFFAYTTTGTPDDTTGYEVASAYLDGTKSALYDYTVATKDFEENSAAIAALMIDYFDTIFTSIDDITTGSLNDVLKDYSFSSFSISGGSFSELASEVFAGLIGGILTTIFPDSGTIEKIVSTVVASELATYDPFADVVLTGRDAFDSGNGGFVANWDTGQLDTYMAPIYEDISQTVSAYADIFNKEFFDAITPEGGTEWDALLGFIDTVNATEDFLEKFDAQMADFGETAYDAYINIMAVTEILTAIDEGMTAIATTELSQTLATLMDDWDTLIESMDLVHATLEDLATAEQARAVDLGTQITGIDATSLQSSILGGTSLETIIGDSINSILAGILAESIIDEYILPLNEAVGQAYLDSGGDLQSVLDVISGYDLSAANEEIIAFQEAMDLLVDSLADNTADIESFWWDINDVISELTMSDFDFAIYKLNQWYYEQIDIAEELGMSIADVNYAYSLQVKKLQELAAFERTSTLAGGMIDYNTALDSGYLPSGDMLLKTLMASSEGLETWAAAIDLINVSIKSDNDDLYDFIQALVGVSTAYTELNKLYYAGTITSSEYNSLLDETLSLYDQSVSSINNAKDAYQDFIDSIGDYLGTLTDTSEVINLSYERAKRNYQSTLSAALAGDTGAQGDLIDVAGSFLKASQKYNSSQYGYQKDIGIVRRSLEAVQEVTVDEIETIDKLLAEAQIQTFAIDDLNSAMYDNTGTLEAIRTELENYHSEAAEMAKLSLDFYAAGALSDVEFLESLNILSELSALEPGHLDELSDEEMNLQSSLFDTYLGDQSPIAQLLYTISESIALSLVPVSAPPVTTTTTTGGTTDIPTATTGSDVYDLVTSYATKITEGPYAGYFDFGSNMTKYLESTNADLAGTSHFYLSEENIKKWDSTVARMLSIPGYAEGGISSGPTSGYSAMLHGTEAIIPLNNGYIPVEIKDSDTANEIKMLKEELRSANIEIIKTNKQLLKILDRVTQGKTTVRTTAVAA